MGQSSVTEPDRLTAASEPQRYHEAKPAIVPSGDFTGLLRVSFFGGAFGRTCPCEASAVSRIVDSISAKHL
jgi:hypothetical protein